LDARELPAEQAALEAQHAAQAREAAGALLDAGAQAVVRAQALPDAELEAAALSDAEPGVAAAEPRASPVGQEGRPWPAADHPSAALPSRAP
jgi:hypothetical protein